MTTTPLQQHYQQLMSEWEEEAVSHEQPRHAYFLDYACKLLDDSHGYNFSDFRPAYFITETALGNRYHVVDGYCYDDSEDTLTLVICDFSDDEELQKLSKGDFDNHYKRLERFYNDVKRGKYDTVAPGRDLYDLVRLIRGKQKFDGIFLHLITNKECAFTPPEQKEVDDGCSIHYNVSDFRTISEAKPQPLVIDFTQFKDKPYSDGLPFLDANGGSGADFFKAYLLVMPAEALASCYDTFRARILERNVRVYLQKKGKVNQGIHDTISKEPQVFFVYNNGLAITADAVDFSDDGKKIVRIHGLQVVNGGQTMACLHHAWKDKKEICNITIQAKLTVIPSRITSVIVPYISRYSNSQNAVKDTDQHSNDFVQICFEKLSQKIKTPGSVPTTWFYERMRGQYANAQLHMRPSEQKAFEKRNPKKQVVQPVALSQAVMTFEMMPYLVVRGAQKTYNGVGRIKGFCDYTAAVWNVWPAYITSDDWYKECMGKYIFTNKAKKIIKDVVKIECEQLTSFSASITTYSISTLVYLLSERDMSINCQRIWDAQEIDDTLAENLRVVARYLLQHISQRADHSEWLKKQDTWEILKQKAQEGGIHLNTDNGFYACKKPVLISELGKVRDDQEDLSMEQNQVMCKLPDMVWESLHAWLERTGLELSDSLQKVLKKRLMSQKLTKNQSKDLLKMFHDAQEGGWVSPMDPNQRVNIDKPDIVEIVGNPVQEFFDNKQGDILILDRSADLQSGSIFVKELFERRLDIELEERSHYQNCSPELGSFAAFDVGMGRKVVLIYTRTYHNSAPYLPILEVCLQAIAAEFRGKTIMMSYPGCESGTAVELLQRRDIMGVVNKILYSHVVTVAGLK